MERLDEMNIGSNVVLLKQDSVYDTIRTFLNDKGSRSENTRIAYEYDITQFFNFMLGKSLEELNENDLIFKHSEIVKYRTYLASQYDNSSVNRKMSALKKLYTFLERDMAHITSNVFNLDKLKENPNHRGVIYPNEAFLMMEKVLSHYRGLEKSLLIEFAAKTSFRISAILNTTWDDFYKENGIWVVKVIDKGNVVDKKPIKDEFYNRLKVLDNGKYSDNKVFHFTKKTCNAMIKRLCKELDLDPRRNITFHSLKKTAIHWALENTGDIRLAARQGNHKSIETTMKYYAETQNCYDDMPGLNMDSTIDSDNLYNFSKEQIIDAIKKCNPQVIRNILNSLEKDE